MTGYPALQADRDFVRRCMPSNTQELTVGGTIGWSYKITCELGNEYSLFLYFDGRGRYQVKCVFPEVEGKHFNIHEHHLFGDGRLCLDPTSTGAPSIDYAYTKSVLWANGWSIFELTGKFPYSLPH